MSENKHIIQPDPWASLRSYTAARIALGRTGVSIPLKENLNFRLAHAYARDAVFASLQTETLLKGFVENKWESMVLQSQCATRNEYLQRPDKGRKLDEASVEKLKGYGSKGFDIALVVADGLSAIAINEHVLPLLSLVIPALETRFSIAPIAVVQQGRVAIADEIGNMLNAKLTMILIGERPGLTSPNSMGAYITYNPMVGLTDERRNCLSNIRPEGLPYPIAANKITYLITQSLRLQISGVELKDEADRLDVG